MSNKASIHHHHHHQQQQQQQQSDIWEAVDNADISEVQRLLAEAPIHIFTSPNPNWKYAGTINVVMKAACEDLVDILRLVITTHPSSVDIKDEEGVTALMYAADNNNLESARVLIDGGASLNLQHIFGWTALMFAVIKCNVESAGLLIERGCALDLKNTEDWTALILAVKCNNIESARLLIEKGASLNLQNFNGHTALMWAVNNNNVECARLLTEKGATLDLQSNENKFTALFWAINFNNKESARFLIDRGASLELQSYMGETVLEFARKHKRDEITVMLVEQLRWLARRDFLMFLATQSYLPAAPPTLADTMSRDELDAYYQQHHYNPETRPVTSAVHSVFYMEEMQRYIMSFFGPRNS